MWKRRFGFGGKAAVGPGACWLWEKTQPGPGMLTALLVSSLALLSLSSSYQVMTKTVRTTAELQSSSLLWPLTSSLPPSILYLAAQAFLRQIALKSISGSLSSAG